MLPNNITKTNKNGEDPTTKRHFDNLFVTGYPASCDFIACGEARVDDFDKIIAFPF